MKFDRNPFSRIHQSLIRDTPIALVGLGGIGGFAFENLLRLGAENLIVFDNDRFELTNFNRQVLSTDSTLDRTKTSAARARARKINGNAKVRAYRSFRSLDEKIIIDATDNLETRIALSRIARNERIPYVFASANDSRGIVSLFTDYEFEKAFQVAGKQTGKCSTITCPAAAVSGSIAASQAVNHIIGKPVIKAPKALFFDLERPDPFWMVDLE